MAFKDREERINKLNSFSLGDVLDQFLVESNETRIGTPEANITIKNDKISSYVNHPVNPGFSFSTIESYIRTGDILNFNKEHYKFRFSDGLQQINPLADTKASSVTDPIPTIIPTIPLSIKAFLDKNYLNMLKALKDAGSL